MTVTANAADNAGVAGVQFRLDNNPLAAEDTTSPYSVSWNTTTVANGTHTLTALARDTSGNTALSAAVTVTVANATAPGSFENEILATGFALPTAMKFLPDGRMLVAELGGKIKVLPRPTHSPTRHPSCSSPMSARPVMGPSRSRVSTTLYGSELRDQPLLLRHLHRPHTQPRSPLALYGQCHTRPAPYPGSELVLYQDPQDANTEHHGLASISATTG